MQSGNIENFKIHDLEKKHNEYKILQPDILFIENTSRETLIEQSKQFEVTQQEAIEQHTLTDDEKQKIKEETGWSDEIINFIQNIKQYENLQKAGLKEVEINGRKCLIKENLDLDYTDKDGVSNRERMERGLAPLDSKTGKPIELHHLGQKADSPLVELTQEEHRGRDQEGNSNYSIWHDKDSPTEVHGPGNSWNQERQEHWKKRAE